MSRADAPHPGEPASSGDAEAAIRADERATRARELHDTIGQSLVALSFDVARLVRHADSGGTMVRPLAEVLASQVEAAIALVRAKQSAWLVAPEGSAPAVSFARQVIARTEEAARRGGFAFRVDVDVDDRRLDAGAARAAGRALAAALDDVVCRAGATRVVVRATLDDAGLAIVVEDDGRSVGPDVAGASASTGLLSMREQTAAYRGVVVLESPPDGGARVRLTFRDALKSESAR